MDELLHIARDGAVHTITIDSPRYRNALSRALMTQLLAAWDTIGTDHDVRAVVLRAAGPVFCAGADLHEAATADADAQTVTSELLLAVLRRIVALPVPVVASVHGPVRAGGVGLVAACDLAIAADDATFALGEVRLGLAPAVISTVLVPRLADRDAARLLLGAETFDGHHAAAVGLVTSAVPAGELDAAVATVVARFADSPRQGLEATKALLNRSLVGRIDRDGPALGALSARLFRSAIAQEHFERYRDR